MAAQAIFAPRCGLLGGGDKFSAMEETSRAPRHSEVLKERAHINADARTLGDAPDFSSRIHLGRPGFEFLSWVPRVH
jgi:hypothetical protein